MTHSSLPVLAVQPVCALPSTSAAAPSEPSDQRTAVGLLGRAAHAARPWSVLSSPAGAAPVRNTARPCLAGPL